VSRNLIESRIDFAPQEIESSSEMRSCPGCGRESLLPIASLDERCFRCWRKANPFEGVAAARIDSAGEDSTNPDRVRDGSSTWNAGLYGVDTVVGTRPNGKPMTEYRPLTNNEVGSNRRRRELAKRQGLEPMERSVYRTLR
jgi:hypothetical protein